ncbi:MAG: hypothetical protein JST37_09515 [Bacteroidetes bacterium]|nr:hypothetical protein [Bacteroidota bacterium]
MPAPSPPRDSRILADTTTSKNKLQPVVGLSDSIISSVTEIPKKFISQADQKITKYSNRLSSKTEKTLIKLSKWEEKLKPIIEKASPQTAKQLFGPGKVTFSSLLQKLQEGKNLVKKAKAPYDAYRDKLVTSLAYIQSEKKKFKKPYMDAVDKVQQNAGELEQNLANTEAVEKFIKQRKKELLDQCIKYAIKSRYLKKINKEAYYYVETIRNYKELFSDPKKAEQTAKEILNKIPAFKNFFSQNSMFASLMGIGNVGNTGTSTNPSQAEILNKLHLSLSGTPGGPEQAISNQIQNAQAQLNQIKLKFPNGKNPNGAIGFKPNSQRSKTFFQRLEYEFNYQFAKTNAFLPNAADFALTAGYKLNDRSIIGLGINYKMGIGSFSKIQITHQGIGMRTFLDWKIKGGFYASGSVEFMRNDGFKRVSELQQYNLLQTSGLIGVSKKLNISNQFFSATKIQVLYDVFYNKKEPVTKPFVFRIAYTF